MTVLSHYKAENRFAALLLAIVALSVWASHYIPDAYFDSAVTPILMSASTAVAFCCAGITYRHTDGQRIRRIWAGTLLIWGLLDGIYVISWLFMGEPVMNMGAYELPTIELALGDLLGWTLILFPTEALRPGWLNLPKVLAQVLPIFVLAVLDYLLPVNLRILVALYPIFLLLLLFTHVHEYRQWCEDNFSSLEDIDEKSILRYMCVGLLVAGVYLYMNVSHAHTRGFTQQWLVIFILYYGTNMILFRKDPWELAMRPVKDGPPQEEIIPPQPSEAARRALEMWMEKEKPYLSPDFKLADLQNVLPMNRTYLSRFIHTEYDCSFYLFVNRYRVDEAKRLMSGNPGMKMGDVSSRCGFSSPSVFSRTFTAIAGLSPSEWGNKQVGKI